MGSSTNTGVAAAQNSASQALYGNNNAGGGAPGTAQALQNSNPLNPTAIGGAAGAAGASGAGGPSLASVNQGLDANYNPATIQQQLNQTTQAQLTNATNQGIQQAAGTVASTKGINPALAGRLAGQNAAQSTQQAANQSAALQGQNSLAAHNMGLQAQGQLSGNLNNQYNTSQGAINTSNSANAGSNTAMTSAGIGAVGGAISGLSSAAMYNGGQVRANYDEGGSIAPLASIDTSQAQGPAKATNSQSKLSQALNGTASGSPSAYTSGYNVGKAIGGAFKSPQAPGSDGMATSNDWANYMGAGNQAGQEQRAQGQMPDSQAWANSMGAPDANYAKGGRIPSHRKVPAMVSPGEKYITPSEMKKVEAGKKSPLAAGKTIAGKEVVKGAVNSLQNDIVPKTLESGGVIIPKTITKAPKDERSAKASKFVAAIMASKQMKRKR